MDRRILLSLLALGALTACKRPGQVSREVVSQSLAGVMLYPKSQPMSLSSGDSAGQLVLFNTDAPDSIAAWYRNALDRAHWTQQSDQRQADGTILIYAERRGQPLWISIQPAPGAKGTTYSLTGAMTGSADSTTDSTQRSGSSMSSKRIQRR